MDMSGGYPPALRPGERLLWQGAPDARKTFGHGDALQIPFSILWAGFAVFWEASVIASGAPVFFMIWGVPFCVVGFYITVGRFVVRRRTRRRTTYLLTDRRAVITIGQSTREMPLAGQPLSINRSHDGRHATVVFGYDTRGWQSNAFGGSRRTGPPPFAFEDVADPQPLLAAVESARQVSSS